jgi:quercetin dioxygenase-like cupin family protein
VTKRVSKGDWILVPAGQPHQYPAVEAGGLRLMALHLPKKVG